jgi:circadian clock protein KaiC
LPVNQGPVPLGTQCPTGIEGLDEIVGGGLPRKRLYLVQGDPGVGKTTLSLQFLLEGIRRGESGLYVTLSETAEELASVAESHDWNLAKLNILDLSAMEQKLRETENSFFHPSEVELNRTTDFLQSEVERLNPVRVVFDSLSELRMLAESPLRYRRQILRLKQFFSGKHCTVLFLDDRATSNPDLQVESIAHGVLTLLKTSPQYGVARRQLNVVKIRGVPFREGFHDFVLRKGGMIVFPRLVAAEHHRSFLDENLSSGIPALDKLLGGGLGRGTSTMFMGAPGTGKSTVAAKFALAAAERGERVLFFIFDETSVTMRGRIRHLGMDFDPHLNSGLIHLQQIDPAEISPGELVCQIRRAVFKENTRLVVIDSINGYLNAMPEERYLTLQLHELLVFLGQQGVITLMVLAQQGLIGPMRSTVDLTYLADTVVLFRYFEHRGHVNQALSVIKKRSGDHERTIRQMKVTASGIQVGKPLTEFEGVLTGVPSIPAAKAEAPEE